MNCGAYHSCFKMANRFKFLDELINFSETGRNEVNTYIKLVQVMNIAQFYNTRFFVLLKNSSINIGRRNYSYNLFNSPCFHSPFICDCQKGILYRVLLHSRV